MVDTIGLKRRPTPEDRAKALDLWVEARERVMDELAIDAAWLVRRGFRNEATPLWSAARILRERAIEERAQAAAHRMRLH